MVGGKIAVAGRGHGQPSNYAAGYAENGQTLLDRNRQVFHGRLGRAAGCRYVIEELLDEIMDDIRIEGTLCDLDAVTRE